MSDFLPPVVGRLTGDISDYLAKLAQASAATEAFAKGMPDTLGRHRTRIGDEGTKAGDLYGGRFSDTVQKRVGAALKTLPEVKVDMDSTWAERRLGEIRTHLDELSKKRIGVDIDAKMAHVKMAELQAEIAALHRSAASIPLRLDLQSASAELAKAQKAMSDTEKTLVDDLDKHVKEITKKASTDAEGNLRSGLIAAIAGAVPLIGSALGGALIGVGGLGIIAAGIIDQVKNPQVKSAFVDLGHQAKGILDLGSAGFAPILIQGVHEFSAELDKVAPRLVDIQSRMAPLLGQLMSGGVSFFDHLLPGIDALSQAAGPVLTMLAQELPHIADAFSTFFKDISSAAPGAATGLQYVLRFAEGLIIGLGKVIEVFSRLPGPTQAFIAIAVAVGVAVNALAPKVKALKDKLSELGEGALSTNTRMGTLARGAAIVGASLAAMQIAAAALGHSDTAGVNTTTQALRDLADTGAKTSDVTKHLDYDLRGLGTGGMAKAGNAIAGFTENLTGLGSVFDESLTHARERLSSIDAALAQEVQSGNANAAAEQFLAIAAAAQKQGLSIDDLKRGLPQYVDAVTGAGLQAGQMTKGTDELTQSIQRQRAQLDSLTAAWDKWAGVSLTMDQAELTLHQNILALTDSIKQNGAVWDLNTKAGQANYGALLQAIDGARSFRQAQIAAGVSTDQANASFQESIDKLLGQAKQAGLSASEINKLRVQVGQLVNSLNSIQTDITIRTHFLTEGTPPSQFFHGLAEGGLVLPAAKGLIAGIYPASNPPMIKFAEPETGGEAYIPRLGDAARSLRILAEAASWYGASLVTQDMLAGARDTSTGRVTALAASAPSRGDGAPHVIQANLYLDSMLVYQALIPVSQQQKYRTGTTGLA